MNRQPTIAVIGAGWTGMAAAAHLTAHADVTLFEASRTAGGRARTVQIDGHFSFLDNGQHLLLGAYHHTFALLEQAGIDPENAFVREPMNWHIHEGVDIMAHRSLPAPMHILWGVLNAKKWPMAEKWRLLQHMYRLRRWHTRGSPDQTVENWLQHMHTSPLAIQQFWQPLVHSTMNTPISNASLRILANVLVDSVWQQRRYSDYCVPNADLTTLLAEPVLDHIQNQGGEYINQCRIPMLRCVNGKVDVAGRYFDAAIVAVAPYHVQHLIPTRQFLTIKNTIDRLNYHAITTVCLRYAQPIGLPQLLTGLAQTTTHWLIDRTRINGANEIAAVISLADQHAHLDADGWVAQVHADILRTSPHLSAPVASQVITEKRATIASVVDRPLPNQKSLNAANIYLAGSWLHPRYPDTIEAAVQSGQMAAQRCLTTLHTPQ